MNEITVIAFVALFILGYGVISRRLERTILTPPMVFTILGLFLSSRMLGLLELEIESEFVNLLTEITLVLILFTDASRIDLRVLRNQFPLPLRLLLVGLPLTIVLGTIIGNVLFPHFIIWEAALLAAILAPTDAALGQAVVNSRKIPVRIRQALNVESGLNDGIVLPVILIFLSLANVEEGTQTASYWVSFVAAQLIFGPLIGFAVGYIGGRLTAWATRIGWMNDAFQRLAALSLALAAFALAELAHGNGFIAAFVAGMAVGNFARPVCDCLYEFAEAEGQLLSLTTFMVFGAIMIFPALDQINPTVILYAILSLTIIRMIPVAISLIGHAFRLDTVLFIGWFGPRGLASILFALLLAEETGIHTGNEIFTVVIITVLLSIFAHGMTAVPFANLYGNTAEEMRTEPGADDMPEFKPAPEMPTRGGM